MIIRIDQESIRAGKDKSYYFPVDLKFKYLIIDELFPTGTMESVYKNSISKYLSLFSVVIENKCINKRLQIRSKV